MPKETATGAETQGLITLDEFRNTLETSIVTERADRGRASFYVALDHLLEEGDELSKTLETAVLAHDARDSQLTTRTLLQQALRGFITDALRYQPLGEYPGKYLADDFNYSALKESARAWLDLREDISASTKRQDELDNNIVAMQVASNPEEREIPVKLAGTLLSKLFGAQPRILDVGTSQGNVPKALLLDLIPPSVVFYSRGENGEEERPDELRTQAFNLMLREPWTPSHVDGIDLWHPYDENIVFWAFGCSFYPEEMMDKKRVLRYLSLTEARPQSFGFAEGDFAIENPDFTVFDINNEDHIYQVKKGGKLEKGSYSVVVAQTMTYQLSPERRKQLEINAAKYGSFLLLIDFARKGDDGQLVYPEDWSERWLYRAYLKDLQVPNSEYKEFLRFTSGRCQGVQEGDDFQELTTTCHQ